MVVVFRSRPEEVRLVVGGLGVGWSTSGALVVGRGLLWRDCRYGGQLEVGHAAVWSVVELAECGANPLGLLQVEAWAVRGEYRVGVVGEIGISWGCVASARGWAGCRGLESVLID